MHGLVKKKYFLTLKGHGHDIGENYFSKLNAWLHCISTKAFLNRQSKFEIFFLSYKRVTELTIVCYV